MKLHILATITEKAWGGANQFLKILRAELRRAGNYAETSAESDFILMNSYQDLLAAAICLLHFPKKIVVHRLGPIFSYHRRKYWKYVDKLVAQFANIVADSVVFQSHWSLEQTYQFGFNKNKKHVVIGNAVDPTIFFPKSPGVRTGKIKLIATSWSTNPNKGFEYYEFLDKHLDFSKYEFTFVGNCPVRFNNIQQIKALPSAELAYQLRTHDIYVSAVHNDAYSNGILEALASGLPVVALDSGGNREVVEGGGILFKDKNDLLEKITNVADRYSEFQNKISVKSISEITTRYLEAARGSSDGKKRNTLLLVWLIGKVFIVINAVRLADKLRG